MKLSSLLTLLPVLGGVFASDVVVLNKDNFETEVFDSDLSLVEFYAPWCGHCKNLAPEYEIAATTLKDKGIKLAKVDCTVEESVCQTYGVQGYPTLKVFRKSTPADYNGPRKADGIVSYMNKQNLPAISTVDAKNVTDFQKADKVVVIAYGDEKNPVPKVFEDYANSARDNFLFGKFEGADVPTLPGKAKLPAVVLYAEHSKEPIVFPGDLASIEQDKLANFVRTHSLPIFAELGPENFADYAEHGIPIAYLFVDPEDEKSRDAVIKGTEKETAKLRGEYNFVYIDGVRFKDYAESLGADAESLPAFVVQNLGTQDKYVLTEKATAAGVKKFLAGIADKTVQPFVKSEAVPEKQGSVYKLVAKDWENLFSKADKDIFVEFYAPWCGHCQRLAPTWDTLGEKYDNSNVVIAQMDATKNDIPSDAPFRVQSFPTLKFKAAGSADFIDYEGDRSLESLVEFIEEHGKAAPAAPKAETSEEAADDLDEDEKDKKAAHDEL